MLFKRYLKSVLLVESSKDDKKCRRW